SRHTRFSRDWSSDVCSSDLIASQSLPTLELRAACAVEAKDWYSRNSWIQWVFGGVGATVVGHWLSSRRHQHRNEIERQQQQNERSEERRVGEVGATAADEAI